MTIQLMIDLETWGTTPGSDIRSIGACVFDPLTGMVGNCEPVGPHGETYDLPTFYIACDNPVVHYPDESRYTNGHNEPAYPLTRDPRTVQWWSEQSDEARAAFADPVDLRECLERFGLWLSVVTTVHRDVPLTKWDGLRIWSHGPSFDVSIIEAAYRAVNLPVPWHYRAPRDTRTAFDMVGITDHSAHLARFATGTAHHALDDAICQARAVCDAWERVTVLPSLSSDGDTLRQRAIAAVTAYDDWTNQNETAWTGWGDMVIPEGATLWRKNSGEALRLLSAN